MNDYNKKYEIAKKQLKAMLSPNDKYYEIIEDSYEYKNGLLLIIYDDKEHEHEKTHYCINIDAMK